MKSKKQKTILLVEDEVGTARMESEQLQAKGYHIIHVLTGEEAIKTVIEENTAIDLILMDINLGSGIDGTEAARLILLEKDIPIVFISAHTDPEIVEKTEKITSYGYVVKKTGITVLDASIKMAFKLFDAIQKTEEQKQRLSATLDSIGDAVIATDFEGNITGINPVAENLIGWKSEEAIGKPLNEVFILISQNRKPVENPVGKVLQSGKIVGLANHTILISRDGTEYQIADSAAPIINHKGDITGVILVFRDVTEEYRMLEEIAKSQKKYKALYVGMNEGVCQHEIIYNDSGDAVNYRIIDVNPKYEKILHLKKKDIAGKTVTEIYKTDKAPFLDLYSRVARTGEPDWFEVYFPPMEKHFSISVFSPEKDKFVTVFEDITKRRQAEEVLYKSEEKFRVLYNNSPDMYVSVSPDDATILLCNETLLNETGYLKDEVIGSPIFKMYHDDCMDEVKETFQQFVETGVIKNKELILKRKDGSRIDVILNVNAVKDKTGRIMYSISSWRDITEKKKLENQLRQAQKIESVGRLAGGVAHDFNNMLGIILGYTEIALDHVDPAEQLHADLKEIQKAARHSADITRQLLAFARKQNVTPVVLDLGESVADILNTLRRLIGENIDLKWIPGREVWPVMIDPGQIEQILANLCINSRDAIKDVGKITIETENVTIGETFNNGVYYFTAGEYVMLAVSDNGCGMDRDILDNIFEPFFTTKTQGKGTGLGLAMVYGIVKQNGGFINVYSEPGQGTTFKMYLSRYTDQETTRKKMKSGEITEGGGETVLLVEDDISLLKLGQTMLHRLGYNVLIACTPDDAIGIVDQSSDEIHLLITDVIMPDMNGRDLSERLQSLKPGLKCLFMSGYTANVIAHHGVLDEGVHFINKPFTKNGLSAKVREVLDS